MKNIFFLHDEPHTCVYICIRPTTPDRDEVHIREDDFCFVVDDGGIDEIVEI